MKILRIAAALMLSSTACWVLADEPVIANGAGPDVAEPLLQAYESLGADYSPRTEHFLEDGRPTYINRLIVEKSPYLLQHAHNPVNWYPFGEAAFALAKEQNKPVFLSIGYATCHWCHVMERESFENELIAEVMNERFINIKVDREQLPDVDALYMNAVLMINGRGGWPMSNFLDTAGRPFHGGTYYPPETFLQLLNQVADLWVADEDALTDVATQLGNAMTQANALSTTARDIGLREVGRARQMALSRHDDFDGGFSPAPKFPQEALLTFLLNEARLHNDVPSFNAVNYTLQRMTAGGIHDQIAGGFHRYAVDNEWLVPHFEKMLYNQGLLARVLAQAYLLSADPEHARTTRRILDYVQREMTSPEGLFYSATDADSEGAEGTFFLWTPESLAEVLDADDLAIAMDLWNVTESGNFEHQSILYEPSDLPDVAERLSLTEEELRQKRDEISTVLLAARDKRIRPLRDEKIITAWNGLMVSAFAESGDALDDDNYLQVAKQVGDTLWEAMHEDDGQLWRTLYQGETSIAAKQTDYAYLAESYLTLYDIDHDERWLSRAEALTATMIERFWDTAEGGFFMGEATVLGTALSVRPKDMHDSSIPSGNAVALRVLAKLYRRTGNETYDDYANELINAFSDNLVERPGGFYYMLTGVSDHIFGEASRTEYAARGVVRVSGQKVDDNTVAIELAMKPGWHVNSNTPTLEYLIATDITSDNDDLITELSFPEPKMSKLGFEDTELSLFESTVTVQVSVDPGGIDMQTVPVDVHLQACNDEVCLAPESVSLNVPWISP